MTVNCNSSSLSVRQRISSCRQYSEERMDKYIITISREFGSGGRHVGEKLAERLGIAFYDKSIIQMAAAKSGLSYEFIEKNEEHATNSLLYNIYTAASMPSIETAAYFDTPVNDKAYLAQTEVIRELSGENCVIVGRSADYILRDDPSIIKVFVRSNFEDRVDRAVKEYDITSTRAEDKVRKIDKSRANYYRYYTGQRWGIVDNYDLVVNSSFTGVDGAVSVIMALLETRGVGPKAL